MAELDDPRIAMILARRSAPAPPPHAAKRRRCAACDSTWTVGVRCPTCHPDSARRDPDPPNPAARSGMVARCPECGHRINTFSRWCAECGKCVAKPEPPPPPKPPRAVVVKAEPKPSPPPKLELTPLDRAAVADVAKTIRSALKQIERAVEALERHARTSP